MNGIILGNRYELLEKIGEGGMSEVYKAKCNKLNRFVAVKILKKQFANNEEISQKFKREATAIANLSDANIVNVLDVGSQDNIDYIVMEYVSGKTLKDFIKFNGKLTYNTAIKIALQVAKALDCAHKNNIIHRDIKPQNIMVTENGEVKVTDFGIAKSTDSATITNTTSIIGSAHYLSPEQAKGTYIDCRADIYSFGIVMYEMVTGNLPFEGESPVTVALKHLQEEPIPPKNINSSIPDSLNKLILKAIEKEPIKRYQSAREIIKDLQKIQANPDVIIGDQDKFQEQHTIVMSPINSVASKKPGMSKLQEEYYDEDSFDDEDNYDDEYEDDDEDYDDVKKNFKGNKKNKAVIKVLIAISAIIGIFLLGGLGYFLATGSSGKIVVVPNIVGKTITEAKAEVEKLGLQLEIRKTEKSDKPENTIIEVDPKVGTEVKKKSIIGVTVSGGEETFVMRDFRDYDISNIEKILSADGFTNIKKVEEYSDSVEKDKLIRQNPKSKTEIKKDTLIELVISKGPEKKLVEVPNVVGESKESGKAILTEAKLTVIEETKITNNKNEDGKILSQSVVGSKIEEGKSVTIVIGKYEPKTIDIEALGIHNGMSVEDAITILDRNKIKYRIKEAGDLVKSFTKSIEEGGTVEITAKKSETTVPEKPATPPENPATP